MYKKLLLSIGAFGMIIGSTYAKDACPSKTEVKSILKNFNLPPTIKIEDVYPSKRLNGFCEVVFKVSPLNAQYFFISSDGNYIIQGQVIDVKNKRLVAPDLSKYEKLSKDTLDNLEKHVDFVYNKNAKNFIYFITDPQCPFCHEAEGPLKEWAKKNNVAIKVILYPVQTPNGSLHPGSIKKSAELLCDNNSTYDMLEFMYSAPVPKHPCKEGLKKVKQNIKLLQTLGVEGTPTFVGPTGKIETGIANSADAMNKEFDNLIK
jgi:thiol:disulfide interchange protein DsbC